MDFSEDDQGSQPSANEFVTVGTVHDVPEGEGKAFEIDGRSIAVFQVKGEFFAIEDQCPHMGAALSTGFLENCVVSCPWHAWRFDIRDGAWCDNRRVKIDAFETRIVGEELQVSKVAKPKDSATKKENE